MRSKVRLLLECVYSPQILESHDFILPGFKSDKSVQQI